MNINEPIHLTDGMIYGDLIALVTQLEKDRDRWRAALNLCTPGGSEFAHDPESCKAWVQAVRKSNWETIKRTVIANTNLRKILEDATEAFRLVRDGAEGPEIRTLARDLVKKLEEYHVERKTGARPDTASNTVAHQKRN